MIPEIIVALVGIVAGWYGREAVASSLTWYRTRGQVRDARLLSERGEDWLLKYYTEGGQASSLFTLDNGRKIPYLTKPVWCLPSKPTIAIVAYKAALPVDDKTIRYRQSSGQRIWDDQVLCLAGVIERGSVTTVALGTCGYYQYVSMADRLTTEMLACIKGRSSRSPTRDTKAATLDHLAQALLEAQVAGFTVALVVRLNGVDRVLLQTRSGETGVAGHRMAVVPAFVANTSQVVGARIDVERLLFYIELLEELFDREDLIRTLKRPSLDWVTDTWPIDALEAELGRGFVFESLGFGFDAATGELNQAYLAHVVSEKISSDLVKRMSGSWEVQRMTLHDFDGNEVSRLIESKEMYSTSAFTLTLARERMRANADATRGRLGEP